MMACCSSYMKCSELGRCIHLTDDDYKECYYRKNLEQGRNFYAQKAKVGMLEIKVIIEKADEFISAITALAEAMLKSSKSVVVDKPATTSTAKKTPQHNSKPVVEEVPTPVVEEKPVEPDPVEEDDLFGDPTPPPTKTYTFDEVKAKLAKLSQDGKQNEMKALITSFGVNKLSEIPAEKYPEVMGKAEAIK